MESHGRACSCAWSCGSSGVDRSDARTFPPWFLPTPRGGTVSPILVRPVREQLEHDRVIRFLQAKWRRRYTVAINVGAEQESPIRVGESEDRKSVV